MKNVLLVSSSGGHFNQLKILKSNLDEQFNCITITESNKDFQDNTIKLNKKNYSYKKFSRYNNKFNSFFYLCSLFIDARKIIKLQQIDCVISTGAGFSLPFLLTAKMLGCKTIFFESFAKISSPTLTGKLCYKFVDRFYVQWEDMLKIYPKAIFKGGIYE